LLCSSTTMDHAVTQQRQAGLSGELAITSTGPRLPAGALADARATSGVRSAVALTPTTLGPSLGVSDDTIAAEILTGGQGGGLDVGDALLAPELAAGHQTTPLLGTILIQAGDPAAVAHRLRRLALRYPGCGSATGPRWQPRPTPTARPTAGSVRCSSY
jgi:hypothetical protein